MTKPRRSASRCSCARATSSAAARWRSSTACDGLEDYLRRVGADAGTTIYLDRFLEDSIEVDVDAVCDGTDVWIAGDHAARRGGGHPLGRLGLRAPPHTRWARRCSPRSAPRPRGSRGRSAWSACSTCSSPSTDDGLYVIEANPRASRTVPFVSKAIGLPVAKIACRVMLGERLAVSASAGRHLNGHVCVKEVVLPFDRFAGADSLLGPEMRSTGEVMGIARDFPTAFAKAQAAAGATAAQPAAGRSSRWPTATSRPPPAIATMLHDLGFEIIATRGTAQAMRRMGIPAETINKIGEGSPHVVDWIERGEVDLVINTPVGHRRAHRRLRDPLGRRRARDPVHHHDGRRHGGRPRDRRRPRAASPRCSRCRRSTLRQGARGQPTRSHDRPVRPPRGHRHRARDPRRLRGHPLLTTWAARPAGRPVLHAAAAERWGGGEGERPFLPRAFSVLRADAGDELQFLIEDVGPGTRRLCELEPGKELLLVGPLGNGFARPRDGRDPLLVGGGVGIAPLAIWQDELGARTTPPPSSGSGTRATLPGRRAPAQRASSPPTTAASATTGSSPSCSRTSSTTRRAPSRCTPADRRRCSRRSGRSAPSATSRPSSRSSPAWRAASARASGAWCPPRRLRAAVRRRPGARRAAELAGASSVGSSAGAELQGAVANDGRVLRARARLTRSSTRSGTFDAIAARRAFGEELIERFPFAAFVSKTVTLEPRQGNPPPRGCGRSPEG